MAADPVVGMHDRACDAVHEAIRALHRLHAAIAADSMACDWTVPQIAATLEFLVSLSDVVDSTIAKAKAQSEVIASIANLRAQQSRRSD